VTAPGFMTVFPILILVVGKLFKKTSLFPYIAVFNKAADPGSKFKPAFLADY
jgi:hypothetical protein